MNDVSEYAYSDESELQHKAVELACYDQPSAKPQDGMEKRYDEFAAQDWSEEPAEPVQPAPVPVQSTFSEYAPAAITGAILGTAIALAKYFL